MAKRAHVLDWNGKDLPAELQDLPAGRYLIEPADEHPLTDAEDAAIETGLEDYRAGRLVDAARVRDRANALLGR